MSEHTWIGHKGMVRRHAWATQVILNYLKSGSRTMEEMEREFRLSVYSRGPLKKRLYKLECSGEIVEANGKYRLV